MFVPRFIQCYLRNARAARLQARTERMIGELPPEIRRDIGWPGLYRPRRCAPGRHRFD